MKKPILTFKLTHFYVKKNKQKTNTFTAVLWWENLLKCWQTQFSFEIKKIELQAKKMFTMYIVELLLLQIKITKNKIN